MVIGIDAEFEAVFVTTEKLENAKKFKLRSYLTRTRGLLASKPHEHCWKILGRSKDRSTPSVVVEAYAAHG